MKRSMYLVAVALFVTASVSAAELRTYKNWADSPQGYFMTAAERAQWNSITTDEEAEKFVSEFLSRRVDGFAAEVAKRAEMADKYLSIGKNKGSATLRGKLVIVFGAPANVQTADRAAKKGYVSPPSTAAVTDLGAGVSANVNDRTGDTAMAQVFGSGRAGEVLRDYSFTFSGKTVPALGTDHYVVVVEADAGTGKDRLKDGKQADDLEQKFEAVAQSMIKK